VTVSQAGAPGGSRDSYQVLVGMREEIPGRLEHAVIGPTTGGLVAYDALHDYELTGLLLRDIAEQQVRGPLHFSRAAGAPLGAELLDGQDTRSLVLTAEQSNTSLVFGEAAILKVFRRVAPGPNPDLEVSAALGRLGSPHVAEPYGWIESRPGESDGPGGSGERGERGEGKPSGADEVTVLAVLSRYLRAASDGWSLAATSVRDLYATPDTAAADAGGDFAGEAHRLGAATAAVHKDLLKAFGGEQEGPGAAARLAGQMNARLTAAVTVVPELREHAGLLAGVYARLAALTEPISVQRVHGDYHLGQVMRTQAGWVLLDFEGEPAVPLATRRARSSPLRDVAGMLRSFEYAAWHQLVDHPDRAALERSARDWVHRNTAAFCDGYAAASQAGKTPYGQAGATDPRQHATLLRALECDKAVYEVVYEARNRPSWRPIPLGSLAVMAAESPLAGQEAGMNRVQP
jgi:maltokinase